MAIRPVWRRCISEGHPFVAGPTIDALADAGVATYEVDPEEASGPGLVLFAEPGQALFDAVRRASRGGLDRVIAVGLDNDGVRATVAWRLLNAGASDVLAWRTRDRPASAIAARLERWAEVDRLVDAPMVRDNLIGTSPAWTATLRQAVEAARFTDASVLILGETGTGKELVARLIHSLDRRQRRSDLVVLDCATIVPELAGSEFFGHERGAYTGAITSRDGCFGLADGGTLFLDEIGELPLTLQAELLRAVQERTYKRVGSNVWRKSHFRLVCASNRDLLREVGTGVFRSDLYYRIATVVIRLPPLRERVTDVIPLVQAFLAELHPERDSPELDDAVREHLLARDYPGNVRDLRQLVYRMAARHVGPGPISVGDIPSDERPVGDVTESDWRDAAFENAIRRAVSLGVGLKDIGHAATEIAVDIAVDVEGSLQGAARQLGVTDRTLQLRRAARRAKPGMGTSLGQTLPE